MKTLPLLNVREKIHHPFRSGYDADEEKIRLRLKMERLWKDPKQPLNPRNSLWGLFRVEEIVRILKICCLEAGEVLEIGVGDSPVTDFILTTSKRYEGLDISGYLIAKKKQGVPAHFAASFRRGAFPEDALQDDSYSHVIALDVLQWQREKSLRFFFSELSRVLKKGGILLLSLPVNGCGELSLADLLTLFKTEFILEEMQLFYLSLYRNYCRRWDRFLNNKVSTKWLRGLHKFSKRFGFHKSASYVILLGRKKNLY